MTFESTVRAVAQYVVSPFGLPSQITLNNPRYGMAYLPLSINS